MIKNKKFIYLLLIISVIVLSVKLYNDSREDFSIKTQKKIESLYEEYKSKSFPYANGLTVEEVLEFKKNEIVFVDIREKQEQQVSMIPNALTQEEFEKNIDELKKSKIFILYCTIGSRSGIYTNELLKQGHVAFNLRGGILAWVWAGGKVENKDGQTRNVHVYGPTWNLLPKTHKAIW
jgi:rhodanese-related sulfurtransferase